MEAIVCSQVCDLLFSDSFLCNLVPPGYSFTSASLTVESCVSTCKSRGFTYAGLEYADECYCGTGYAVSPVTAPESDCSMACAGNSTEKCGSGYRLSVYSSEAVSASNTLVLPIYWGKNSSCIVEASTGRTLSGNSLIDSGMTVEKCVSLCDSNGFIYAGLEFAVGFSRAWLCACTESRTGRMLLRKRHFDRKRRWCVCEFE